MDIRNTNTSVQCPNSMHSQLPGDYSKWLHRRLLDALFRLYFIKLYAAENWWTKRAVGDDYRIAIAATTTTTILRFSRWECELLQRIFELYFACELRRTGPTPIDFSSEFSICILHFTRTHTIRMRAEAKSKSSRTELNNSFGYR